MPVPNVVPPAVRYALAPGEVREPLIVIDAVPATGAVTFSIAATAGISLVGVETYEVVTVAIDDEVDPDVPPHMRGNHGGVSETLRVRSGRGDGSAPIHVSAGHEVHVTVRFSAPDAAGLLVASGTLAIAGPGWNVSVPLTMVLGDLAVELLTPVAEVRQGSETVAVVRVTSRSAAETDVHFALIDAPFLSLEPSSRGVAAGESVDVELRIRAAFNTPNMTRSETLKVTAFDGLCDRWLDIRLSVLLGDVSVVSLAPEPLTAVQGQRITAPVRISAAGLAPEVVFQPDLMPAGVTMPVQAWPAVSNASVDRILAIDVQPDAPLHTDAALMVHWTASTAGSGAISFTVTVTPREVTFREIVSSPTGTALGGWVEMTLRYDGSYVFRGHMHGSGFDPYAFRIVAVVRSGSGRGMIAAQKSGGVGGTIGAGSRDFDWHEEGLNPGIAADWGDVSRGALAVNKDYESTGVLGALEDIAAAAVDWLVAAVAASPLTAWIYILGRELGDLTGIPFAPPNLTAGIAVKEGVVLIFGPGRLLWAVAAGVVAAASIRQRSLTGAERMFADRVFRGTIDFDRVVLTDISRGGRKFAIPHVDGRTLIGMGDFYDSPITQSNELYPAAGQVFIHELVHAWQIGHVAFDTELFWDAAQNAVCELTGTNPYVVPSPLPAWSSLNLEQQASAVDQWYRRHKTAIDASSPAALTDEAAIDDPSFQYIASHLWTGAT